MINTIWQKEVLAHRRESRDMQKAGYELVGEGGGLLWQLYRGWRTRHRIVDVKIARDGRSLWCLIKDQPY
jgi:hypothetical protein